MQIRFYFEHVNTGFIGLCVTPAPAKPDGNRLRLFSIPVGGSSALGSHMRATLDVTIISRAFPDALPPFFAACSCAYLSHSVPALMLAVLWGRRKWVLCPRN